MRRHTALSILTWAIFLVGAWNVQTTSQAVADANLSKAYFAGGCFWRMELAFEKVEGALSATSGYMGGTVANPSYEEVSAGRTGHAESVEVVYDPNRQHYRTRADIFDYIEQCHNPRQRRRLVWQLQAEKLLTQLSVETVWNPPPCGGHGATDDLRCSVAI